jgi:hypothetical protein
MVEMDQDCRIYRTQQENFKKKLCKYGKSRFLIAILHFLMALLWGQLHRDFLRFANWTKFSSSGRRVSFYQVPQGQHPLLCTLSTAESLSCPKSIRSIGGPTIFQGQQYSSCSKAGGCRAAQLLGGFRRDLLIVSWVAPTPGCTANSPGNWCSQPLILRPFGRSGQELSVEYQVAPLFIIFSLSTAKKGYRKKPGSGNLEETLFKATIPQRQYQYQNHTKTT